MYSFGNMKLLKLIQKQILYDLILNQIHLMSKFENNC